MTEKSLWNRDFILDTGINFMVYLIYYLLMVIIAVVAKEDMHASLSEAGLASGIFIVGTLLARLQFGKAIELYGRARSLYGGIIFYLLTTVCYFYLTTSLFHRWLSWRYLRALPGGTDRLYRPEIKAESQLEYQYRDRA